MNGHKNCWGEHFEQLYIADTAIKQLPLAGLQTAAAGPPINKTPPSVAEVIEIVKKLKVRRAA